LKTKFVFPDASAIEQAHERIKSYIHRTPVLTSQLINETLGAEIYFKCENFQKIGAFKIRGALNAVMSLNEDQLKCGVCTHSSGNHAQALALAARLRKTKAYIVMPKTASKVKVAAVKQYGGEITFCEPTLASREENIDKIQKKTSATLIHPYNDVNIIAGQATAAKELIEDYPDLDIIMAPVGGGGLLSGTSLAATYFSPNSKVIAGEPENANDAFESFYKKEFIPIVNPNTIADGLLTSLGSITFPIILKNVDQIVTTSEKAIIEAMKLIWERMKIIIEPSSAVPLASILEHKFDHQNKRIGIVLSGGNIDLLNLPW
jgi:threonine dehydratase